MSKFNLVVADTDADYVENLVSYIIANYSERFQVSTFTESSFLMSFLNENSITVDILLVSLELYDALLKKYAKVVIRLSSGKLITQIDNVETINKYQRGDRLIGSILNIFAEKSGKELLISGGCIQTKAIGVYSHNGGVGKTTVAVSSSIQCAQRGLNTFYLNLEDIQSTPAYFKCNSNMNLSNIFYYLREKNRNLALKLEGSRCFDETHKVYYFSPPDSAFDIEEMHSEELVELVHQLKIMGHYDVIFIDMSSKFDSKNLELLKACDEVILVISQDIVSNIKARTAVRELEMISEKHTVTLLNNFTVVSNKWNGDAEFDIKEINLKLQEISVKLPFKEELMNANAIRYMADSSNCFGNCINALLDKVL